MLHCIFLLGKRLFFFFYFLYIWNVLQALFQCLRENKQIFSVPIPVSLVCAFNFLRHHYSAKSHRIFTSVFFFFSYLQSRLRFKPKKSVGRLCVLQCNWSAAKAGILTLSISLHVNVVKTTLMFNLKRQKQKDVRQNVNFNSARWLKLTSLRIASMNFNLPSTVRRDD